MLHHDSEGEASESSGHQSDRDIWRDVTPDQQTLVEARDKFEGSHGDDGKAPLDTNRVIKGKGPQDRVSLSHEWRGRYILGFSQCDALRTGPSMRQGTGFRPACKIWLCDSNRAKLVVKQSERY